MPSVINNVGRVCFFTYFHILCDGPLLDGKTTAISKSPQLNLENVQDMIKKMRDARIWV